MNTGRTSKKFDKIYQEHNTKIWSIPKKDFKIFDVFEELSKVWKLKLTIQQWKRQYIWDKEMEMNFFKIFFSHTIVRLFPNLDEYTNW